ncbi:MAG: T9SS type A sorting domain-containing protein [Bacteroidetes bacterium]|nr:T9SS type A sorting domain-containing protein [Bacteroidota bacterium]MBT5529936.1 T9SS type A sorting domain-containing protein [Cytophagia bacterium]MBT3422171.1 T9SS type A sorting domain-containing protein [Bacteroidota bacterium]MBT3801673.1 T9SS type A sorting domain-containing protein [Bacteroidota bacterium]MBT4337480.1 T9SS type A sorting domain-containing protein [Bacteroidota bacterium]
MRKFIYIVLFFISTLPSFAQLSGTYSIGSGASNFSSIQQAVDSLIVQGINGPVVFNLVNSVYSEQIRIPEINGASSSNTITIQSDLNSNATWTYDSATANKNYVLKLDSADHFIIQGILFTNPSLNFGRLIEIDGDANHNAFIKNGFTGQNVNSTSDNYALVYSSGGRDTLNIFDSNSFSKGSVGLYWSGSGNPESYNQVINNSFWGQYARAIYCSNQAELLIENNYIGSNSSASTFTGIEVENSTDYVKVIRNQISFSSEGFCLLLDAIQAQAGTEALIANNFLHAGGNTAAIGVFVETSNYINIYNNNINITSTTIGSAGRAINIQDVNGRTSHIKMRNNIIVNRGLGFGIITFTTDTVSSDYNCFYTPNCPFGYWNGYSTNTMAIWWLYTNQDSNSIIANPGFFSPSNLHVSQRNLDSNGLSLAEVIYDIDGDVRDSLYPDIGADEFNVFLNDIGLTQIVDPIAPCPNASSMISVRVKNFGLDTINSIEFDWFVNGLKKNSNPIVKTVVLAPGQATNIMLASYIFPSNKPTDIIIIANRVNLKTDTNSFNNMVVRTFQTALTGNYTIGPTGDYTSISNAVSDLHELGVCGPIDFYIEAGIYIGQISINDIKGISSNSRVRFIGEKSTTDSVIIQFTAAQWYANYTLKIGSPWVGFENVSIINDGATYGRVIDLVGATHGVTFSKNNIIGLSSVSASSEFALIYAADNFSTDSLMLFDSNHFIDGSYGIWISGLSLNDFGSSNYITNNQFKNQFVIAIQGLYQKGLHIIGNHIETSTSYSNYAAIQIQNSFNNFVISKNKINVKQGRYGINIVYTNGNINERGLISNNFIHIGGSFSNVKGIGLDNSSFTNIYNNSIHITTDHYSASGLFINSNVTNSWVYNNNLVNTGPGYALSYFGVTYLKSDYNNIYTTSNNFAWFNGNRLDLSAWQLSTKYDSNSVSANPYFTSKTDLHSKAIELDSAGTRLQKVLYDIDGDLRNPYFLDIGADEFVLLSSDAGVVDCPTFSETACDGMKSLQVELINYGVIRLDSIDIVWSINNQVADTATYYGALGYLKSDTLTLGNYSFNADSNYTITFFTLFPNGQTDEKHENDSFTIRDLNIVSFPQNIQTHDTLSCFNDSALLEATASNAYSYFWFDSIASGALQHIGQTFKTPKLKNTTTYFVEARSKAIPDSLKTTYNSGLGNLTNGCMFDVSAISTDLTIDSFDIHTLYKNDYPVWVYYKKGSYVGFQNDSASWILLDSTTVNAQGFEKATRVPIGGFTIPKGEMYAIYITTIPVSFLNFSSGNSTYLDDELAIWPGIALDYLFDATFAVSAVFNGQIYYSSGAFCQTERKAATVFVKEKPNVILPVDTFVCYQQTLELNGNHGPSYSYEWRKLPSSAVISSSEIFSIISNGIYSLTVDDGCGHIDIDTIQVISALNPEADFILNDTSQCIYNNRIVCTNKSFVLLDSLIYHWDFGDGDTSSAENPKHKYTKDSVYRVTLKAISDKGCMDSLSRNVYINPKPEVDFSIAINSNCLNDNSFDFYNSSKIKSGSLTYKWLFSDNYTNTVDSIFNYGFKSNGSFSIQLIGKSNYACYDTFSKSVNVKENPVIDLGKDTTLCAEQHLVLAPGFGFDSYLWSNDSTDAAILVDTNKVGIGLQTFWVQVSENGCESYDTILVTFVICGSIEEENHTVLVYPNPVSDLLHIKFDGFTSSNELVILVLNIEGKQLLIDHVGSSNTSQTNSINVSQLPEGMYILQIKGEHYYSHVKFIKK